jgi:Lrp/AsnC family transcriptional regulator, regulator for asnA, asnC and gidA
MYAICSGNGGVCPYDMVGLVPLGEHVSVFSRRFRPPERLFDRRAFHLNVRMRVEVANVDEDGENADLQIRRKMGYLVAAPVRGRAKPGPKPHEGLDDVDISLLRALNGDARKSYRDLSKELGLALSTVSARVKRLEAQGYITGYVPVIDPTKLGFDLVVIVGVKILHGKLLDAQKRIAKLPRVFGVYDVTGDWDSMILARFRDREELNDFIKELLTLPYVERTGTQLVLNTVKEEKRVLF